MKQKLLFFFSLGLAAVGFSQTTVTYNYTGAVQTYTVPACVTSITVDVYGAQGGNASVGGTGGLGGYVTGTLPVTPGDVLYIYVGGQNGYNGGGDGGQDGNTVFSGSPGALAPSGGGASDIRIGGITVNDRVVVAGGGGGGGSNGVWPGCQVAGPAGNGGDGGGLTGGNGTFGVGTPCNCGGGGGDGGQGGTQSTGGAHGNYYGNTACLRSSWGPGADGTLAQGGAGSLLYHNGTGGGGGGGGGYYGGGSGGNGSDTTPGGGGGGGSSWTGSLTSASTTAGSRTGDGMIVLTIPPSGSPPVAPSAISGNGTICEGTSAMYSVPTVAGATSYTWTVPAGSSVTAGQGTDMVTITAGATSGTISVTADNSCGSSPATTFTLTINPLPAVTATAASGTICDGATETLTASGASSYVWSSGGTAATENVMPSASTTYTVTGTDGNGCDNTATVSVTVNPLPVVTATVSSLTICAGTNDTLTASGAMAYSWSSGGNASVEVFAPVADATVTVTGTDANGCMNTASVVITVNALPAVMATAASAALCSGDSTLLTASGAASYSWSTGGMNATEMVVPAGTTTYTVTGNDSLGCSNSSTVTVVVNDNPVVTIVPGPQSGCAPLCVSFTSNGSPSCVTSLWDFADASTDNTQNPVHCFQAGGTYNVSYLCTDANGCTGTMTTPVVVYTAPIATLSAATTSSCLSDGPVTLTGSPAGGTYSGPGVTGNSYSPATAGLGSHTISYVYADSNGCSDSANVTMTVNACTGIGELGAPGAVTIFPNPNNGAFTLNVNSNTGDLLIEITDLEGRVVFVSTENNVNAGFSKEISLDHAATGVYLLKLTANGQQTVQRISVQR